VEDALLTGMEIYFPFTGSSPDGKQIELTVWQDEGGFPGAVIFRQTVNARSSIAKNQPVRYDFARPVLLAGTFYIGFRQNSPGSLAIGLDRNTSSGDKFFFNLGELWEMNTLVQGSLMMRPVFGEVTDVIVGTENDPAYIQPFPNPSETGIFYLTSTTGKLRMTDLSGRSIPVEVQHSGANQYMIRVLQPVKGIYLLHDGVRTHKLIIP
jgi:hypothetical protein